MGDAGRDHDEVAQRAVRGASVLLGLLGDTLEDFFGEYSSAANALLDARSTEVHQRVELKKSRARELFDARFGDLAAPRREEEFALINVQASLQGDDTRVAHVCPACEQTGVLSGLSDLEVDVDGELVDGEAQTVMIGADIVLTCNTFRCPFCSLMLHGQEELTDAELPLRVPVRGANDDDLQAYFDMEWERYEDRD
jgi:hypothetical protein